MPGQFPHPPEKRFVALVAELQRRVRILEHRANDPTEVGGVLNRPIFASTNSPQTNAPGWQHNTSTGESDWFGADGSAMSINPTPGVGVGITAALQGIYEAALQMSTPDGNQTEPGFITSAILNPGAANQQMASFFHAPFGANGSMAMAMISASDDATKGPTIIFGSLVSQAGIDVITPVCAITANAFVLYGPGGSITSQTLTGSGNFTTPTTLLGNVMKVECWGASAGSGNWAGGAITAEGGRGGSGGGEYACEPALAVTPNTAYAYTVGQAGTAGQGPTGVAGGAASANTTFAGNSVTVTAHPGLTSGSGVAGGLGGTGSGNSIHFNGGNGGNGVLAFSSSASLFILSGAAGGGGGASAGPGGPGKNGQNGKGTTGGKGGIPANGGATGGLGGGLTGTGATQNGSQGGSPGAGSGGGCFGSVSGAAGRNGSIRLTYVTTAPPIVFSVANSFGADLFGSTYPGFVQTSLALQSGQANFPSLLLANQGSAPAAVAGEAVTYADGSGILRSKPDPNTSDTNIYGCTRLIQRLTTAFTVNSTTAQTIFSVVLAAIPYDIDIWAVYSNTTAADSAGFAFAFTGTTNFSLVDYESLSTGTATVGYSASNTLTTQFNGQGVAGNQRLLAHLHISVLTTGTLTFTGKELVSGNTISMFAGSRLRMLQV